MLLSFSSAAVSLEAAAALLRKWHEQSQEVFVVFSGASHNVATLFCSGKISGINSTKFTVVWGKNDSAEFRYDNAKYEISEQGHAVRIVFPASAETTVICEAFESGE